MDDTLIRSWRDMALFVAPMLIVLAMSFFRVDAAVASSRRRVAGTARQRRARANLPRSFCDAEARPWRQAASINIEEAQIPEEKLSLGSFRCRTTRRLVRR